MTAGAFPELVELERPLDALLRSEHRDMGFFRALRTAQREWSQAVWSAAESLGASDATPFDVDRGVMLAARPVFVCGAARSGTTLLRNLLDSHPELAVIPNESVFYTWLEPALARMSADRHCHFLGSRWLERLVDPPPFWLLGRSDPAHSPYVDFACAFAGWWQLPERRREARVCSWPLAAFALAYAQHLGAGRLPAEIRMWVEKTPGSERSLLRIWHDFPAAKVIQIVRRPEDVLASIKSVSEYHWTRRSLASHIVRDLAASYRVAANVTRRRDARYLLVRYEELTDQPEAVMNRIADFLGIEPLQALLRPTTAGRPAVNNTSFRIARPDPRDVLGRIDRALLRLATGRQAGKLGYAPQAAANGRSHSLVGHGA